MLDPRLNLFYASWSAARGERELPAVGDVSPERIKTLVSDCFMLSRDAHDDFRYRHAGTRYRARYCRDLIGRSFLSSWDGDERNAMQRSLKALSMAPLFGYMKITGYSDQEQSLPMECLLLPVSYPGEDHYRIMGLMISKDRPYWLGMNPIVYQQTDFLRLRIPPDVDPVTEDVVAFSEPLFDRDTWRGRSPQEKRTANRPQLVVIQGGLES